MTELAADRATLPLGVVAGVASTASAFAHGPGRRLSPLVYRLAHELALSAAC